jgi:hypothetical protein
MGLNGFIFKKNDKNLDIKEKLKSWEPFRSCLLNSTANPAHFHQNWAGLAVLIFIYFFKYGTIENYSCAFLTLNILAIGRVFVSI